MNETLPPYPFTENECKQTVEEKTRSNFQELLETPLFDGFDKKKLFDTFNLYYGFAEMLFSEEEELRAQEVPGANLYYHGIPHAIFQTTYDAISIVHALSKRNNPHNTHHIERTDPML